jgi:hypothetical protein
MSWRFHNGRLAAPNGGEWSARSGPWGKGKLPDGLYRIGAAVSLSRASNTSYKDAADFAWWCPITPRFDTPRSGLGIHPDGGISGTLGCVGIVDGIPGPCTIYSSGLKERRYWSVNFEGNSMPGPMCPLLVSETRSYHIRGEDDGNRRNPGQ